MHDFFQARAVPLTVGQQVVARRQRVNSRQKVATVVPFVFAQALHGDRLDRRQHVFHAMIELLNQQRLALFSLLAGRDVKHHSRQAVARAVGAWSIAALVAHPSHCAVATRDAEFGRVAAAVAHGLIPGAPRRDRGRRGGQTRSRRPDAWTTPPESRVSRSCWRRARCLFEAISARQAPIFAAASA